MTFRFHNEWKSYGFSFVPFAVYWYRAVTTKTSPWTRWIDVVIFNFRLSLGYIGGKNV